MDPTPDLLRTCSLDAASRARLDAVAPALLGVAWALISGRVCIDDAIDEFARIVSRVAGASIGAVPPPDPACPYCRLPRSHHPDGACPTPTSAQEARS